MQRKTLLITGASRGIGFETSKSISDQGHRVIAAARSAESLEKLKKHAPDRIDVISADITNTADIQRITAHIESNNVQLDGIVHNAGLLINKPFSDLTDSDWREMININIMAPVTLTRVLLKYIKEGAHILNISSMGGYQNSSKFSGLSGYSTTKGALSILTECLAVELDRQKIHVNCLCLGAVQTEMLEEAFPGMNAPVEPAGMGKYISEFVLQGHQFYSGKILPVSLSDPG